MHPLSLGYHRYSVLGEVSAVVDFSVSMHALVAAHSESDEVERIVVRCSHFKSNNAD